MWAFFVPEKDVKIKYASSSGSIIPELQNRFTHYDITNRGTNSKILFFLNFFELLTQCEKNFNIVLELVTPDF